MFILVYTEFVIDFKHLCYFLQVAMKEKMLTKLERDRAVGQVSFVEGKFQGTVPAKTIHLFVYVDQ